MISLEFKHAIEYQPVTSEIYHTFLSTKTRAFRIVFKWQNKHPESTICLPMSYSVSRGANFDRSAFSSS